MALSTAAAFLRAPLFAVGRQILVSAVEMLAPRHCLLCQSPYGKEWRFEFICHSCADSLEPAPYPDELLNRLISIFPGDTLSISRITGLYALTETPPLFQLLYALKYRGHTRIGVEFGKELGAVLTMFGQVDYDAVLPVPIHPAKKRERGYNQAMIIAEGIGQTLALPIQTHWLTRKAYTRSQTTMTAHERKANVAHVFAAGSGAHNIRNKSILLVDDVLTTGSTLNACATTLLELGARRVDAATLAVAG